MENASKAIIMAGSILIAVVIIGMVIYMFSSSGKLFGEEINIEKTEQLVLFNNEYESYNRKLLRGTDVISIINKAISNNTKYGIKGSNEPNYFMQVEFEMKEALVYTQTGTSDNVNFEVGQRYNITSFNNIKNNVEAFTDFKRRIFDCEELKYNRKTGRVNYIFFIERKMNDTEYKNGIIYD